MNQVSFKERINYAFDNYMAKGTVALIGGLGILSIIVIIIASVVVVVSGVAPEGSEKLSFFEAFWESLMRTLDAGTMGGDTGWGFRIVMFLIPTLGGVFIISTLIGVLTSGIEGKMEELRKGRSRVVESNHVVILGWSSKIFTIISELIIANENQKNSCIVVLGDKDKVEMEDEIRENIDSFGNTRLVCRTGNPIDLNDLELVSLQTSRAILVLSPENVDNPDAEVIKSLLAITNNPKRRQEPYHIVAEIHDPKNIEVARMVGKDEAELVLIGNLVSRIVAQTCRQSGLSIVYTELLDFGGDEIYAAEDPGLVGKTFGDAIMMYEDSAVIGIQKAGQAPQLSPSMDTVFSAGDKVFAVTADDDTLKLSGKTNYEINKDDISLSTKIVGEPEKTLILGWNWRAPIIINELDNYVPKGSIVTIMADFPDGQSELNRVCDNLKNQKIKFILGDTTDRRLLDELDAATYNHVIVLCYADTLDVQAADARTLITLLHLRDIADKCGKDFSIVSEMLDLRNRALAEIARADDFIVSDRIISLMLSQVVENKSLNAIFTDIFDPEGAEIYLKPISSYVKTGKSINFYTIVEAARQKGEIALGYRLESDSSNADKSYGVTVNPKKSQKVAFTEGDKVIVIAEE